MRSLATKVLDGSVVLDPAGLRGQSGHEVVAGSRGSEASGRGRRSESTYRGSGPSGLGPRFGAFVMPLNTRPSGAGLAGKEYR